MVGHRLTQILCLWLAAAAGCGGEQTIRGEWLEFDEPLPEAISNNAVAGGLVDGDCFVLSAGGIAAPFSYADITDQVWYWNGGRWNETSLPGGIGRVAMSAVLVKGRFVVLGGYSVDADGSETSFDRVDILDPLTGEWTEGKPIPVPVDDAVAVAWRDQRVVVVSGWSNTGNISDVQIYEVAGDFWMPSTPFPGTAVFGHAGALSGNELLIIDGVATVGVGFELVNQAWRGYLDPNDPSAIRWENLSGHDGPARYRAAGGATVTEGLWFHGGTAEPYNFDGLTYSGGTPAQPMASTMRYRAGVFFDAPAKAIPTMDHRALAQCGERLILVGGMEAGPAATSRTWEFTP